MIASFMTDGIYYTYRICYQSRNNTDLRTKILYEIVSLSMVKAELRTQDRKRESGLQRFTLAWEVISFIHIFYFSHVDTEKIKFNRKFCLHLSSDYT